jgi:GH43 family beta-xylosidase
MAGRISSSITIVATKKIQGDPLKNRDRATRAQVIHWKADGIPDFGVPVADGPIQ